MCICRWGWLCVYTNCKVLLISGYLYYWCFRKHSEECSSVQMKVKAAVLSKIEKSNYYSWKLSFRAEVRLIHCFLNIAYQDINLTHCWKYIYICFSTSTMFGPNGQVVPRNDRKLCKYYLTFFSKVYYLSCILKIFLINSWIRRVPFVTSVPRLTIVLCSSLQVVTRNIRKSYEYYVISSKIFIINLSFLNITRRVVDPLGLFL